MTRALVVFESMFGNTETIARSVADGLSSHMEVDLAEVGAAPAVIGEDVRLLVVGGPTHVHGMSGSRSREGAANQADGGVVSSGIGLREWLAVIPRERRGVTAASFDTRFKKPRWLVGSAARVAGKRLRRLGFDLVRSPESFFVAGTKGPLLEGEPERARRWGDALGSDLTLMDRSDPEVPWGSR